MGSDLKPNSKGGDHRTATQAGSGCTRQTRSENRGKASREKRWRTLSIIEKEGAGGGPKANTVLGKVMLTDTVISKALQTQPAKQAGSRAQAGDER